MFLADAVAEADDSATRIDAEVRRAGEPLIAPATARALTRFLARLFDRTGQVGDTDLGGTRQALRATVVGQTSTPKLSRWTTIAGGTRGAALTRRCAVGASARTAAGVGRRCVTAAGLRVGARRELRGTATGGPRIARTLRRPDRLHRAAARCQQEDQRPPHRRDGSRCIVERTRRIELFGSGDDYGELSESSRHPISTA